MKTNNLINQIQAYLSNGGLFNPELADHLAVRNLLMECREALAQPEQEPDCVGTGVCVQTGLVCLGQPPQRKPLSDEEIYSLADSLEIWNEDDEEWILDPNTFARAIEAAHGIKG